MCINSNIVLNEIPLPFNFTSLYTYIYKVAYYDLMVCILLNNYNFNIY